MPPGISAQGWCGGCARSNESYRSAFMLAGMSRRGAGLGRLLGALLPLLAWPAAAQAPPEAAPPPRAASFAELPGWPGDDLLAVLAPLLETCRAIAAWPADRPLGGDPAG